MSQDALFDLSPTGPAGAAAPAALVVAATDGSARPNPGTAAGSWYVSPTCWAAVAVPGTSTNNVGELTAIRALLEAAPAEQPLHVVYDSTYAFQCVTTWARGWSRNGRLAPADWRTRDGAPVKNADLIADICARLAGRTVTWAKVKSHTTLTTAAHGLNREADARAAAVVTAVAAGRRPELGPGWTR